MIKITIEPLSYTVSTTTDDTDKVVVHLSRLPVAVHKPDDNNIELQLSEATLSRILRICKHKCIG